jgi:hypothetical protein
MKSTGDSSRRVPDDRAQVVRRVSFVQAGDDVRERFALVLQVDHVGLREDRAAAGHGRRRLARESLRMNAASRSRAALVGLGSDAAIAVSRQPAGR